MHRLRGLQTALPCTDKINIDATSFQRANEQAQDDVDERILQEIYGCVYMDTEGYKKYLEGKERSAQAERAPSERTRKSLTSAGHPVHIS